MCGILQVEVNVKFTHGHHHENAKGRETESKFDQMTGDHSIQHTVTSKMDMYERSNEDCNPPSGHHGHDPAQGYKTIFLDDVDYIPEKDDSVFHLSSDEMNRCDENDVVWIDYVMHV